MTCLADCQYNLNDFNRIGRTINTDTNIGQETVDVINQLAQRVGAPEYQRTPVFKKRNEHRHARRPQKSVITNADWQEMRNFKTTSLKKNEEGIEKEIDDLRMLLNKVTATNYHEMKDNIISILTKILDTSPPEEELIKVGSSIFEIGCLNKFWAKLYAQLYKDLIGIFPVMTSIYQKNFESFLSLFDVIQFVSAEEDYDKFCAVNKENAKRRAISSFFIHLMMNDVLQPVKVMNLITTLVDKFMVSIDQDNMRDEVDEIAENLCILIGESKQSLHNEDGYDSIVEFVENVAGMNHRDYKSLTSKTVFKFMDLADED